MNILIVEDEEPAALRLKKLLIEIDPEIKVLDNLVSIQSTVDWLKSHKAPDLLFMDIQLADGSSFEIFHRIELKKPVIFITAFDEFAIDAFKVNSIDYLLKPVKKDDLELAIQKFKQLHQSGKTTEVDLKKLLDKVPLTDSGFKKRFMIRFGDQIRTVETEEIAYFYTEDKINFLRTHDNRTFPLDLNLDKLDHALDPKTFFRINRQFIISFQSIDQMYAYSKSRVKVKLKPPSNLETIVSTERSPAFKIWLGDE